MTTTSVGPIARELLGGFEFNAGRPRLPDAALDAWAVRLLDVPDPEGLAAELIVVVTQLVADTGAACEEAVGQLLVLVAVLLLDEERAVSAFAAAGIAVGAAQQVTGYAASRIPVGHAPRPAGSTSPLTLRLKGGKP